MIRVADRHIPHLLGSGDEPGRPAPSRAVMKGIGKAIGMIYGPVERELPHDLAALIQRLPGAENFSRPGAGRGSSHS